MGGNGTANKRGRVTLCGEYERENGVWGSVKEQRKTKDEDEVWLALSQMTTDLSTMVGTSAGDRQEILLF